VAIMLAAGTMVAPAGAQLLAGAEAAYQQDADAKRVADVHKIAALLEQYKRATGHYPYHDRAVEAPYGKVAYMVTVGMPSAEEALKRRPNPFGINVRTLYSRDLIGVLKDALKRDIVLPVDPQKVPLASPNAYFVFFLDDDTYLVTAFLYGAHPNAAVLARNVNLYGVTSQPNGFLSGMKLRARVFSSVPAEALAAIEREGVRTDAIFARTSAISNDGK
jgi:hypothetical protein